MQTGFSRSSIGLAALFLLAACAPAAPSPTAAPKPTEAPKPTAAAATAAPAAVPTSPAPAAAAPPAKADTRAVEEFYRGKTIRVIVGSAPGGGFDTYARAVARHMGKHIPGSPNVIVDNVPGAGSLKAANQVYRTESKDGTVVGHIQGGLFLQQLLGLEGVEFEALKWQLLGVSSSDNNTCVVTRDSGIASLTDVMNPGGKELIVGGNAPGSATWDVAMRLKSALDLNLKMVDGYDGTAKIRLAMDQGEVDGVCGWGYESVRATAWDRVEAGDYRVIAQVTEQPMPELEQVPLALQLAKTDEARQLIRLGIMVPSRILRPFLVAPEVPAERVHALREAFEATMKDKDFIADAEKSQLELDPITGQEAERLIRELFEMPENIKAKLKQINDKQI